MNATRLAVLVGLFACGERSSLEPGSHPEHLAFFVQPGTSAVGSPITPAVQVVMLDSSGNLLTGFSGQVTVALYSQECGDSLSGTTTVNAVAGVAAFADLRLHRVCYDILQATTPALLPAFTSVPFLVHPAGITQIAFTRDSNVIDVYDHAVIYVMNVDGSGLTKLAADTVAYFTPTWSPDSRKIAFVDGRDAFKLHVMNADGSGVTRVGEGIIAYSGPAWSPDGTKLLFNSPDQSGGAALYTGHVDGAGLERLGNANVVDPSWSPDGTAIAFAATNGDGHNHNFLAHADGI